MEAKPVSTAIPEIQPVTITPPDWNNRQLFKLLWPLIVEQLLIVTMGIIDMVMVSSVGEHAVSGVSLVDTVNFLFVTAFSAMATGGSVVASQYLGRKDSKNACSSARQLIYISVSISVVIMVLTMLLCRIMLSAIYGNIAGDVMQAAQTYFLITALSYPFLALHTSTSAIYRSMGKSNITMWAAVLVNIIKVAGNALFIYYMGLGVAGAALSTLIARIVISFLLVTYLTQDWAHVVNLKGLTKIKLEKVMIKRILNIGIPSGLETSMFQIGKVLIMRIFTAFGTAALAANAVSGTINSIAFMPGSAFGMGLLIIAGQFIGAGDYDGAKRFTKKMIKMSYVTYLLININILIFMNPIIGIFNLSAEAYRLCVIFLRIHLVTSTLFWCPSFVLPNALKAAGDAKYVMVVAASTMWLVRVCSAFLMAFPLGLGPTAVSLAMGADFLFRGIFFTKRWLNGRWMDKRVI